MSRNIRTDNLMVEVYEKIIEREEKKGNFVSMTSASRIAAVGINNLGGVIEDN